MNILAVRRAVPISKAGALIQVFSRTAYPRKMFADTGILNMVDGALRYGFSEAMPLGYTHPTDRGFA